MEGEFIRPKQFFVWGPVGGLETIPAEYSRDYARKSRLIEWVRRAAIKMLPLNFGFKKRCKRADLMLCKTEITRDLVPAKHRERAVLFTKVLNESTPQVAINEILTFVFNEQHKKNLKRLR